jgi:ATP-binding cassette, subfamily F, member 3
MLLIQAADLTFAHGGRRVLAGASMEVKTGERSAVVGANGAGKSTLLKLLAKELAPQAGAVTHARGLSVGVLAQDPVFPDGASVRDVVALAAGDPAALEARAADLERRMGEAADDDELAALLDAHAEVLARLDGAGAADDEAAARVLAGLGLPRERWDDPVARLSGGERKLVGLARLLLERPTVLLLDEPDAHLDFSARAWLEREVAAYPGAVVFVSHDRTFIDRAANRIVELEDGALSTWVGNWAAYLTEKQERLVRAAQLRELQEREFKKLKASAEQLTQWARQNPKFASRAENQRRKLAEERAKLEATPVPVLERRTIDLAFAAERGSTLVLEASGLAKTFGDRDVFRPFDLAIRHGESVGLVGPNGAGKTTFLRTVMGEERPSAGTLRLGPSTVVGYAAQGGETLDPAQTPIGFVRSLVPVTEHQAIGLLGDYLFDRDLGMTPIGKLSGGQRARLQIAGLILRGANFLVLDEPTNNLDIGSIEALEGALLAFLAAGSGAILAVSHDRAFLDHVCGRILELDDGAVRDYPGGFSYWERHAGAGTPLTRDLAPAAAAPAAKRAGKTRRGA